MVTRLDTPLKLASAGTGFKPYLVPSLFSKHKFLRLLSSRLFFLTRAAVFSYPHTALFLLFLGSWNQPGKTSNFSENGSFAFPVVPWATGPEGGIEKAGLVVWQEARLFHCYPFSQGTRVLVRFLITELCEPAIAERLPANSWMIAFP